MNVIFEPFEESPEWVSEAYSSLIQAWITAQDLQSFEEAIGGLAYLEWGEVNRRLFNSVNILRTHLTPQNGITEEELDDIVEYWQQHYNPSRCTRMLSASAVMQTVRFEPIPWHKTDFNLNQRVPLRPDEIARVKHPVMMIMVKLL